MTTKERIIETAVTLFNEQGTKAVTTNHIAAAMGISPGNLYYHYRNKEEIIRAIYEQMDEVGMSNYQQIITRVPPGSLQAMEETFAMIQRFNWRYRFFKRELTALLLNDPLLKERHVTTHRMMLGVVRHSIENSVAQGILRPMPRQELDLFVEEVWLLTLFWLNYLEVGGEPVDSASLSRGNSVVRQAVRCRLTEKGLTLLEDYLSSVSTANPALS
nr:TetR/AcrR family transcriptional regulator [uncultured Desulfuromonas sp.]